MAAHSTITRTASAVGAWLYAQTHRNPPIDRLVVDLAEPRRGERALDIGCGAGAAVDDAARRGVGLVAAVDASSTMVTIAARRVPRADVRQASAERLPFDDAMFDVVWAVQSLHHWTGVDLALGEARRVLAPGGRILLAERVLYGRWGHGSTTADLDKLPARVQRAGFVDDRISTHSVGRREIAVLHAVASGPSGPTGPAGSP